MNKTYITNILRDIKNTKGKVISIATMVGLASLVVVALTMTGASMRKTLNNSLKTYVHPDIIVRSTYGLDYEDEMILKRDPDIEKMTMVKTSDLIEDENLIRLKSYNKSIAKSAVIEGRMPEHKNEIALDTSLSNDYKIGDKLKFSYIENSQTDEKTMNNLSYKVVGFFKSSDYFMEDMRELSFTAKKELSGYGYILDENFDTDKFGEANIVYKKTKGIDKNSSEYKDFVERKQENIEEAIKNRPHEVLKDIKKDANKELDKAQKDVNDVRNQLDEGENKLESSRAELDQGYRDYENGKKTLDDQIAKGKIDLENARVELIDGQKKLDQGRVKYEQNLKEYNYEIKTAENQINKKQKELEAGEAELKSGQEKMNVGYDKLNAEFSPHRQKLKDSKDKLDRTKAEIDQKSAQLEDLIKQKENSPDTSTNVNDQDINALKIELASSREAYKRDLSDYQIKSKDLENKYNKEKENLDKSQADIEQKRQMLNDGWSKLKSGKSELENKKANGKAQLDKALNEINQKKADIDNGWANYNNGKKELENREVEGKEELKKSYQKLLDGEDEYQKNYKAFKEKETNALGEIKDGQKDIEENKDTLSRLSNPVYDIETIYDNQGIKTYHQNSLNMDELTKVFPTFFYLVAMLVTLTTMKRYIDEQRMINGTLKSLGYTDNQISQRFYIYGIIPTLIGSIIGSLIGRYVVAGVIIDAYSSGFSNLSVDYVNSLPYIIFAVILSTFLIAVTIFVVSNQTVKETPAALLRAKSPDSGKKILLEKISPIWKKLSFMQKITSRNLFRYKSRMFMTLFGIGGCTALTFFGFAMIDSIKDTVNLQQNQISHYDVIAMVDEKAKDSDLKKFQEVIKNYSSMPIRFEEMTIKRNGVSRKFNLVIPEDNNIKDFFTLRSPKRDSIDLTNEDAVISEKASDVLNLKTNENLNIQYQGKYFDLPISGIIENYTGDYIFISKDKFKKIVGKYPQTNAYYLRGDADEIIENIEDESAVNSIIDASVIYASMDVLMDNLNIVIAVITLISVLLALVVLYNLININVSERKRELATIKVLGFYPKEVTSYIFREIFMLTILGIIVGYGLGYAMFRYIIYVVAPENILLSYRVHPSSFLISGLITIGISIVLLFVVHKKLKKIDMAEAMSSGE